MSRWMMITAIMLIFPVALAADVTKEDVRKLVAGGVSDSVIVAYIRANQPVRHLSSDDILELKNAGTSDTVLEELMKTNGRQSLTAATSEPQVVEKQTIVVQQPVQTAPVYYTSSYATDYAYYSWPTYSYYSYPTYSYYPYYRSCYSYYPSYYRSHRPYYYSSYRSHYYPRASFNYYRCGKSSRGGISFTW